MKTGDLVVVGPKYVMSDRAPNVGNGTLEADQWTGRTYRVVGFDKTNGVKLADPALINADESDEVVTINRRRLTPH